MITNEKLHNKGYIRKFSDFYKIKKRIGLGPKGNTYKVQDLKRNDEMRIVKMMKKKIGRNSLTLTESNIETLLNLDHPNVGLIYDIIEDEKFVYMVQDFYEQGDLFNFILKNQKISEKLCKIIIKQMLCAVKYLHENNICHREIKPQNVFIVKYDPKDLNETMIKVVDFGASCYFKDCIPLTEFPGNPFYSGPEVINGEYDHKIDIWSVGVIAYFLLCGHPPYSGKEYDVLFKVII
jgi:calcium-dependent protein kinase